jgi:hypothetical protein
VATSIALTGVDQLVYSGPGVLFGWSIRETAAAAASARIRDGLTVAGPIIAVFGTAANGYDTVGGLYLRFATGLFFDVVAGTIEGAVWLE